MGGNESVSSLLSLLLLLLLLFSKVFLRLWFLLSAVDRVGMKASEKSTYHYVITLLSL